MPALSMPRRGIRRGASQRSGRSVAESGNRRRVAKTNEAGYHYDAIKRRAILPFVTRNNTPNANHVRKSMMDLHEAEVINAGMNGAFDLINESADNFLDLDEVWDRFLSDRDPKLRGIADVLRDVRDDVRIAEERGVAEHLVHAMTNSMFDKYLGSCAAIGSWQLCTQDNCDEIFNLVSQMQVGCRQRELISDPALPQLDLDCNAPDEETPLYGLQKPVFMELPDRCKVKFGFGYKADLCPEFRPAVERQMDNGAQILRDAGTRQIVNMMFNLFDPSNPALANPWSFKYNGAEQSVYMTQAQAANGGKWANLICNNKITFDEICNRVPLKFARWLMQQVRDPRDGRRMRCCDPLTIFTPSQCVAEHLRSLMNPTSVERCVGGPCNAKETSAPVALDGFSGVFWSQCLEDLFTDRLQMLRPDATVEEIELIKKRTIFIGCPDKMFAWLTEWALTKCERRGDNCNTWENFNQEVLFLTKYMWKVSPAYLNPWAGQLWAGSQDCPEA